MRYAIVPYPIPEGILKSGLIAETNETARKNNSFTKCIVGFNDAFHPVFRGYATLDSDDLFHYIESNPQEWDKEYIHKEKVEVENTTKTYAISDNYTEDGKVLYTKIHGQKQNVAAGQEYTFTFSNPYSEVYFQGAEIMQDIIGVADFDIYHPVYQVPIEQYGYDVNLGTLKYIRESKYAARIPQGLELRCVYKNDTTETQEVGVNFLLHEIRDA